MAWKSRLGFNRTDTLISFLLKHYGWVWVILCPFILFGPMLVTGKILFWGTPFLQFIPWREFAREAILRGHLPLWNPWLGMGAPLVANYQSAIFYPPNWLLLITGSAWGHGLLVLLHIVWAGIGMLLLVKQLGMSKLSQAVAALSFSLSGYLIARAGFLSINATVAWLPWIILAADRMVVQQSLPGNNSRLIKPALFLSLVLCLQWLAGHAQTAWYCFLLTLVWTSWRGFSLRRGIGLIQALLVLGIASTVAFLLSAIQLTPTLEYLIHSHRVTEVERELAMVYSFWPWRILGLLMPNLFGNPAIGDYWGYANYWEDAIYIGIFPLLLCIFACVRGFIKSKYSSLVRLLFTVTILSFLLALGKNTPIFPFLYEHVPTFDLFQAPSRWTILMVFSLSLLAAIGAELWQQKELLSLFWVRLGTVGAGAAGIFALFGERLFSDLRESFIPAIILASLWLMLSGIIAWRHRIRPANYWPILTSAFIAVDLLWAAKGLNPSIPVDVFQGESEMIEQVSSDHRVYMPAEMEETIKFEWTHRFDTFYPDVEWRLVRDTGLPNTTMLDRIPSANNFDPILPDRYVTWMDALGKASGVKFSELLGLMDVGWEARLESGQEYEIRYYPVQNPERVHLVGEAIWANSGEEALKTLLHSDFDFTNQVVLEGTPSHYGSTNPEDSSISIIDQSDPNKVEIKVASTEAGWLVLSDSWYPGWQAEVDDVPVDLYRANYLFKAVRIPEGEHWVEFTYRPFSFILGGTISLFSWILIGAFLWILKRK
jgi:uncharacterized membrane protein YfhO